MPGACPGPFRGGVPLPLPLPCDALHVGLGFLAGWWPTPGGRRAAVGAYLLYQALEEGLLGDGWSFTKDMLVFGLGFWLGRALGRRPCPGDAAPLPPAPPPAQS